MRELDSTLASYRVMTVRVLFAVVLSCDFEHSSISIDENIFMGACEDCKLKNRG